MRIGLIGAGNIGGTLARRFLDLGHEIAISNSRGPGTLEGLITDLGKAAHAMTVFDAANFGEIVVLAIPFRGYLEVPVEPLAGKIVVDANNYFAGRDGRTEEIESGRSSSSELLQLHLPASRVVKAFNAIRWSRLLNDGLPAGNPARIAIPIAGDDSQAKGIVAKLIEQIGFDPVDAGDLATGGRKFQQGTRLFAADLSRDKVIQTLAE